MGIVVMVTLMVNTVFHVELKPEENEPLFHVEHHSCTNLRHCLSTEPSFRVEMA